MDVSLSKVKALKHRLNEHHGRNLGRGHSVRPIHRRNHAHGIRLRVDAPPCPPRPAVRPAFTSVTATDAAKGPDIEKAAGRKFRSFCYIERAPAGASADSRMRSKLFVIFLLLQLRKVLNATTDPPNYKRSPFEVRPSGDLPTDPVHRPLADLKTPTNAETSVILKKDSNRKKKAPSIDSKSTYQLLMPKYNIAVSKVHHSAVHTGLKHYITKGNVKVPVITQTISHSSANITHPTKLVQILLPVQNDRFPGHKATILVPDLSVIPLHHQTNPRKDSLVKMTHRISTMENKEDYEDSYQSNRFRTYYGGYGVGLGFGGHGAGHGFYAYG
ncbi:hypothetical protein EVAR_15853_1 [Eumeta japonica]|uniref:Uncharacterized protein n=1 Tax=Eumeta variegata TaxID=151549 RepID=A0A4C1UEV9_EUMVA|nr:hypothetical protein EVAR_15853_1 [Eumeta japonica]